MSAGCAAPADRAPIEAPDEAPSSIALRDARLPGGERTDIRIARGLITHVERGAPAADRERGLDGAFVVPQIIDSHVHLAYLPVAEELRAAGIAAVVDLGAPLATLRKDDPMETVESGPMITATRGYPTQSWGRDGYGFEVASTDEARAAVERLVSAGAGVIKVALAGERGLDRELLAAVVRAAHERDRLVVGHALGAEDVQAAAATGVDVLAHVPLEPLDEAAVRAWSGRAVITTLSAFAPEAAAANLRRLIAGGATPIYGTDLGNTRLPGISAPEIEAMAMAGMSGGDILASMTTAPAALWNLDVGRLAPGQRACLMILADDPSAAPDALAIPRERIGCN